MFSSETLYSLAVGIGSSGATAVAGSAIRSWRERRGSLAGAWLQVTFPEGSELNNGDPIRSIELLEVRHRGAAVKGTMWRIWREHYERAWRFSGRYDDGVIDLIYWPLRGDGGKGSVHLWHVSGAVYSGKFVSTISDVEPRAVSHAFTEAPIQWVRATSTESGEYWSLLSGREAESARARLPRTKKRLLQALIENLPYGAATTDLTPALERERVRREEATKKSDHDLRHGE